jgi:AcrR family transcriptional regulator
VTDGPLSDPPAPRILDAPEAPHRADAILALARQAFIEKGFDSASMQDLARAAGMSAGNFYRYFPSKAALIEAMVDREVSHIASEFQVISASPDPLSALKLAFRGHMASTCYEDDTLWAEISAAAARKPEVAQALQRMEDCITIGIARALALVCGLPDAEAVGHFRTHSRAVFLTIHGVMTGNRPVGVNDDDLIGLMMRTINWILDDAIVSWRDKSP